MTQLPGFFALASVWFGLLTGCAVQNRNTTTANSLSQQPLPLAPLASFEAIVPKDDQTGGVGANFNCVLVCC